jgi:hypothetical protein
VLFDRIAEEGQSRTERTALVAIRVRGADIAWRRAVGGGKRDLHG